MISSWNRLIRTGYMTKSTMLIRTYCVIYWQSFEEIKLLLKKEGELRKKKRNT
jgi:hypothetical protein